MNNLLGFNYNYKDFGRELDIKNMQCKNMVKYIKIC